MMGMPGSVMGGSRKESQTAEPSAVLVKESVVGNVKVIVEYPPARVGAITTCTVSPHVEIVERLASVVTY